MQAWSGNYGKCVFCTIRSYERFASLGAQSRSFNSTRCLSRNRTQASSPSRSKRLDGIGPSNFPRSGRIVPILDEQSLKQHLEKFRAELQNPPKKPADKLLQCITLDPILKHWATFKTNVLEGVRGKKPSELQSSIQRATKRAKEHGVQIALRSSYADYVASQGTSDEDVRFQQKIADLRYPTEWFPITRALQRHIHLHIGPTNSGKTFHALKRLEESKSGFYAGPLRLLAHEVYSRFNAKGIRCGLVTGDEVKGMDEGPPITCHTVEMAPMERDVDVAVIDEIQMIGDPQRGWAWTNALLGAKAAEVHVCGEVRTAPLVRELTASMGDTLHIHHYDRLNPLKAMPTSLKGNLKRLQKGDCLVCFTVIGLHAMKREVEVTTGRRCAIVYGSLPPEIRAQQAELFNDPNNDFDFLVASDAVGMGLNLNIKRIIFESVWKNDGLKMTQLSVSALKQIAGRAGRYRTAANPGNDDDGQQQSSTDDTMAPGLVTALSDRDMPFIQNAMKDEPEPIKQAGLLPPSAIVDRFATMYDPATPFSYITRRLHHVALVHPRFFLCNIDQQCLIADAIHRVKKLSSLDRHTIAASPAGVRFGAEDSGRIVGALSRCIAEQKGNLLDIPEIELEVLDLPVAGDRSYLLKLEELHKALILYLWLSYRFAGVFTTRPMAFHAKSLVEEKIDQALLEFSANTKLRKKLLAEKQRNIARQMEEQEALKESDDQTREEIAAERADSEHNAEETVEGQADSEPIVEESRSVLDGITIPGDALSETHSQESGDTEVLNLVSEIIAAEVGPSTSIDEADAADEEPLGAETDESPLASETTSLEGENAVQEDSIQEEVGASDTFTRQHTQKVSGILETSHGPENIRDQPKHSSDALNFYL